MAEKTTQKKGKKRWYHIFPPSVISKNSLGESSAYDPNSLVGRTISKNLGEVLGDHKAQNVQITFKINKIIENKATSKVTGYELLSSFLRRSVKPGKSRIDDSFIAKTKDNVQVKLKSLIVTRFKCQKSLQRALRDSARAYLIKKAASLDYERLVNEIVFHKLQFELRDTVKKLYPVNVAEVRVMKRI